MTLPAAELVGPYPFVKVTVAGWFHDLRTGAPLTGHNLHARPTAPWLADLAGHRLAVPSTATAACDGAGFVAVELEPTDTEGVVPTGWTWSITDPTRRSFPLSVPADTPILDDPGSPLHGRPVIWLADALPPVVGDGTPTIQRITGPQGPVGPPGPPLATPVEVPYAASIAYDVALGDHHRTVLTGPLHIERPRNAEDGARLVVEVQQDAVGGWPVSLDPCFGTGFDIVSVNPSQLPWKRTYILALYSEHEDSFDIVGVVRGYSGTP